MSDSTELSESLPSLPASESVAESKKENGKPLPSMHSDLYYPEIKPSIHNGVLTMSMAVLNLLGK